MVWKDDNTDAKGDLLNFIEKVISRVTLRGDYYEDYHHIVQRPLTINPTLAFKILILSHSISTIYPTYNHTRKLQLLDTN